MLTLQVILDELAKGPEGDVAALLREYDGDLSAIEAEALEAFDAIREGGQALTDEDVAALDAIAAAVEAIRGEATRREDAVAEQQARIDAIAQRVRPDGQPAEDVTDDGGDTVEQPTEQVPAAAAVIPRVDVAAITARRGRPAPPEDADAGPTFSDVFTATADVPGIPTGAGYTNVAQLAAAFARRANAKPRERVGIARIRKQGFTAETTITDGTVNSQRVLDRVADPANLTAAGWCSPSETWYDVCDGGISTRGLFSLPEVNAPRGGVRFTKGIEAVDLVANPDADGFNLTEAQMIANTTKPCVTVACPTFEPEVRLGVEGICVQTDIPMDGSFPEAVEDFIAKVLRLHARKVSGDRLAAIYAGSVNKGTVGDASAGAVSTYFSALDLMAHHVRSGLLESWDFPLEAPVPEWVRAIFRADVIKRNGLQMDDALTLADSLINAAFALRNVNPQWIGTQLPGDVNGTTWDTPAELEAAIVAPAVQTLWPSTYTQVLYPAGTWVAATKDVIDVETVYDAALLQQNKYTKLFMESGVAVINRCWTSIKYVVNLCPDGTTAALADLLCANTP